MKPFGALSCEVLNEFRYRSGYLLSCVIVVVEHFYECPLRPVVIFRVAGTHFSFPVIAEAYFVHLLAVARYVFISCFFGVLSSLYGVLFRGKSVSVVSHRMQNVEAFEAFVAAEDIAGDVAQRMSDMQSRSRGVGEHIKDVVFGFAAINAGAVDTCFAPLVLPTAFYITEIVF